MFLATLIGLNANSVSPSKIIQTWMRWGWYPLECGLGGSHRHRHTQQISSNPIHGDHYNAWLEMAALWMEKAGTEIYRQSKGSKSEEGGGLLWSRSLQEETNQIDKWQFWKERLRVIGNFEGSNEEIKNVVRKIERAMKETENSVQA